MKKAAALILLGFIAAAGAEVNVEWILDRLGKIEENIRCVSFDFTQDIEFTETDLRQKTEGAAVFLKPDKLKITKRDPREQVTISDGKKVWVYTPSYNQVWIADWKDWQKTTGLWPKGMIPIHDLSSYLRKEFNLTAERAWGGSTIRLKGTPKEETMGYTLDVVISTRTWLPAETEFHSGSARIVTRLTNVVVNPAVDEAAFQFTPPKGVELIPFE